MRTKENGRKREKKQIMACQEGNIPNNKNKMHEKQHGFVWKTLNRFFGFGKIIDTIWKECYNTKRKFSKLLKTSFECLQQTKIRRNEN